MYNSLVFNAKIVLHSAKLNLSEMIITEIQAITFKQFY